MNLNEVPRIPHGFDVFSCVIYKQLEKSRFRNNISEVRGSLLGGQNELKMMTFWRGRKSRSVL